ECFGTTGETAYETCTLLITGYSDCEEKGAVSLFGRTIAKAFSRDSGARLGDDVVFISGTYKSGGSVKNWNTDVRNATFEIHKFPIPSLDLPSVKKAIEESWCEVKLSKKKRAKEEIQAEIDSLKTRIEELETELNG
ncbi:MAG: hypothetical protein Q8J97_13055, partial [Flavobacteriaceae bacterium]|nr:hypothetical protein [Flavobacteriaceae bacterium]